MSEAIVCEACKRHDCPTLPGATVMDWGIQQEAHRSALLNCNAVQIALLKTTIAQLAELGEGWTAVFDPNGMGERAESIRLNQVRHCGYELLQTIDPSRRWDISSLSSKEPTNA